MITEREAGLNYYGNQDARMEEFRGLSYDEFKQHLLEIHASIPDIDEPGRFINRDNILDAGIGIKYMPRHEDKDWLMKHALEQAQGQGDIQDAAVVMNIAISFVHPFLDGNGRTSRILYGMMSRGFTQEKDEVWLSQLAASGARDLVDFSNMDDSWIQEQVYLDSNVERVADGVWWRSDNGDAAKLHYGDREYAGLEDDERQQLDRLIGDKHGSDNNDPGRYGANFAAVWYGLNIISRDYGIELPISIFPTWNLVNIPDSLAKLSGDHKRALIKHIQDYQTLYAKGAIDLYAKSKGSKALMMSGVSTTVGSVILGNTNNYLTSKVK